MMLMMRIIMKDVTKMMLVAIICTIWIFLLLFFPKKNTNFFFGGFDCFPKEPSFILATISPARVLWFAFDSDRSLTFGAIPDRSVWMASLVFVCRVCTMTPTSSMNYKIIIHPNQERNPRKRSVPFVQPDRQTCSVDIEPDAKTNQIEHHIESVHVLLFFWQKM